MADPITKSVNHNIWAKIGITIVISFLLMIPVAHIEDVIRERHEFGQVVKKEVAQKWSKGQAVGAVVLSIPLIQKIENKNEQGRSVFSHKKKTIHFLPDNLKISADVKSVVRYRGVYRVPLYETKVSLSGHFSDVSAKTLEIENATLIWKKAMLSLGVTEVRGLKDVEMMWEDTKVQTYLGKMSSGLDFDSVNGTIAPNDGLTKKGVGRFFIQLTLRGSETLEFYPFGETTTVDITSNWGSPSFKGAFLPENHEIENKKFHAHWKVLGLTRSLPKHWEGEKSLSAELADSKFGVNLHMQLQSYQLTTRSVKYSLLLILLTFVTMFFIEILLGVRFHPMHYGMIGVGLILFYLLLLSFSEHIGFGWAYCVATVTTLITISTYILGITKVKQSAITVFTQLGALYGFLFVLLRQEDFALVFGASGLWVILAILMYATRQVNWFDLGVSSSEKDL